MYQENVGSDEFTGTVLVPSFLDHDADVVSHLWNGVISGSGDVGHRYQTVKKIYSSN